ncbi:MAG: hypothetical protein MRY78_18685, partial [Saprospiraceae bacterium]|nr:hypothetical protein [Saprospiraceae bacterium]
MIENLDFKVIIDSLLAFAPKLVGAILVLFIGFRIVGWITKVIRKNLEKSSVDRDLITFLSSAANILLRVLVVFSA